MRTVLIGRLVLLTIFLSSVGAYAATITVTNTNYDGEGSLRQAVTDAAPGDTIIFAMPEAAAILAGEIVIDKNLAILGPGVDLLWLNGGGGSRIFRVAAGASLTLEGMTMMHGSAIGSGGAIFNSGTLTVNNCVIASGAAGNGGGIFNDGGTLRVTATTFNSNTAENSGGAIFNTGQGSVVVSNTTFAGNSAYRNGGGVANNGAFLSINTTYSENIADRGAAISNLGVFTATNNTIAFNWLRHFPNSDTGAAGINAAGTESLKNTIVAGNTTESGLEYDEIRGAIEVADHSLVGDAATSGAISDGINGNIIGNGGTGFIDPFSILSFGIAANGGPTLTAGLVPGSPAINSGSNSLALDENNNPLTTDQRGLGFPRIIGGTVDIGAFESAATYTFSGFLQPVENLPVVNLAIGGSSIPVKFSLGGNHGLNIFASGYPVSTQVACDSSQPSATIDETSTAGASSLTYDPVTDQYKYIWKTERTWRGSCRLLVVRLNDGSQHTAKFKFR